MGTLYICLYDIRYKCIWSFDTSTRALVCVLACPKYTIFFVDSSFETNFYEIWFVFHELCQTMMFFGLFPLNDLADMKINYRNRFLVVDSRERVGFNHSLISTAKPHLSHFEFSITYKSWTYATPPKSTPRKQLRLC